MTSAAKDQPSSPPPVVTGTRPTKSRKPDPLIGRVVNGRFKVLSLIARGGMGKVYQAEQAPLGRICALKVLNPKYDGDEDPEFQRRFYLEASTAAKLTHPNTVTIFDYGRDEEQDIYYIAMEYVRGRTLFRILREDGTLEEHRVAHVVRQVGRSLREAHGLGVIHRDMKPANVVLVENPGEEDAVKVLDFGLVKDVTGEDAEDLTQQGLFMGSPKYMAPEQILGNPVSPATDVYSVGVVAYELLTGSVPFDKGTSVKTLMAHCNEAPPPMQRVNPNIYLSGEMNSIVMRCLAKDPAERFQSMDELLRALTKVEGGGTLTESLLAGPVVQPPSHVGHDDVRSLIEDPLDSSPTRPMARSSQPAPASQPPASARIPGPPGLPHESLDSFHPDSVRPGSLYPSGTPAPMEQLNLDDLGLEPKKSSAPIRVAIGVVAVVGIVAAAFAFTGGEETAPAGAGSAEAATNATTNETAGSQPRIRTVHVKSEPKGAQVREGAKVVCGATPCDVTWRDEAVDQPHDLELSLDGHKTKVISVAKDAQEITGTLEADPAAKKPTAPKSASRIPRPTVRPQAQPTQPKNQPPTKPKTLSGYKDSPY